MSQQVATKQHMITAVGGPSGFSSPKKAMMSPENMREQHMVMPDMGLLLDLTSPAMYAVTAENRKEIGMMAIERMTRIPTRC